MDELTQLTYPLSDMLAIGLTEWSDTQLVITTMGRFILEADPRAAS